MRISPRAFAGGEAATGAAVAGVANASVADAAIRVRSLFTCPVLVHAAYIAAMPIWRMRNDRAFNAQGMRNIYRESSDK
jgi:hypothetical protein